MGPILSLAGKKLALGCVDTFFDAKESNQRQNCAAVLDSFSWPGRGKTAGFTKAPQMEADTFFVAQRKYPKISIPAVTFFDAKESNQRKAPRIARNPAEKSSAEAKTKLACC